MLRYSLPLLVLGVAGILNQTIDKIIFPWLYPDKANAMIQLGIYSACFKIGVIMVMFTQAFRYAFEPFIFAKSKDSASNRVAYADATKYFILFGLLIFLGVMGYLDVVKYLIKSTYHEGLIVVPIVMMGELFFGIYFNLSLWYKLTDQTKWGAYLSLIGLVVTLAINFAFIPRYGYLACAWASFFANLVMMVFSYFLGQKNYSIDYDLKTIGGFFALALTLFAVMGLSRHVVPTLWPRLFVNTLLIVVYLWMVIKKELPLREVPVIGKYFQKINIIVSVNIALMKKTLLSFVLLFVAFVVFADEGMWILKELNRQSIARMQELGFVFPVDQLYDENNSSLKDAVVIFGGGCSGVAVSEKGLIFTNHHCGYDAIQKLSSVEEDYLKNGFMADSYEKELPADGLTVSFLRSMHDVTEEILPKIPSVLNEVHRELAIDSISDLLLKEYDEDFFTDAHIVPFYAGNKYYMVVYDVFRDVRLVVAPPQSIRKVGDR